MSSTKHKVVLEVPASVVNIISELAVALNQMDEGSGGTAKYIVAVASVREVNGEYRASGGVFGTPKLSAFARYALCGAMDATVDKLFLHSLCEHDRCRRLAFAIRASSAAQGLTLMDDAQNVPGCSGPEGERR